MQVSLYEIVKVFQCVSEIASSKWGEDLVARESPTVRIA